MGTMKTFTSLIILLLTFSLNAQDYFSNNPQWRQDSGCRWWGDCVESQEFVYYINGDSTVNDISYKKVYKHGELSQYWFGPPPNQGCDDFFTFDNFHTLVRQEESKIYIKNYSEPDTLLYDFALDIGDTLPITYIQNGNSYIISEVDSLQIGDSYRKVFYFVNNASDFLIEGVGHYGGFLEPMGVVLECGYFLNCYALNDTTYFPEFGSPCDLTVDIIKNQENEIINVFPNPTSEFLIIEYNSIINIDNVVAYDINGSMTKLKPSIENQNILKLDMTGLRNGLYVIQINCTNRSSKRLKIIKE